MIMRANSALTVPLMFGSSLVRVVNPARRSLYSRTASRTTFGMGCMYAPFRYVTPSGIVKSLFRGKPSCEAGPWDALISLPRPQGNTAAAPRPPARDRSSRLLMFGPKASMCWLMASLESTFPMDGNRSLPEFRGLA